MEDTGGRSLEHWPSRSQTAEDHRCQITGRRQSGDIVYEQGQEEETNGEQTKDYSFQSQAPCNNSFRTLQNLCRYIVKMNQEIGDDTE